MQSFHYTDNFIISLPTVVYLDFSLSLSLFLVAVLCLVHLLSLRKNNRKNRHKKKKKKTEQHPWRTPQSNPLSLQTLRASSLSSKLEEQLLSHMGLCLLLLLSLSSWLLVPHQTLLLSGSLTYSPPLLLQKLLLQPILTDLNFPPFTLTFSPTTTILSLLRRKPLTFHHLLPHKLAPPDPLIILSLSLLN